MKNTIFAQIKKTGLGLTVLAVFMVLSLVLQNAAYVQYVFADEGTAAEEHSSVNSVVSVPPIVAGSSASEGVKTSEEVSQGQEKNSEKLSEEGKGVSAMRMFAAGVNTEKPTVKIIATKVVCDDESKLPNWGLGGPGISSNTAADYVASHSGCTLTPDWKFQWGYASVNDLTGSFIGVADGSKGPGTNTGGNTNDWKTFGPTNANGVATVDVTKLDSSNLIWVREVQKEGYIPFTYDPSHRVNDNDKSAEMYCHTDVFNYDNYDNISNPQLGSTYYCIAFNVLKKATPPPPPSPTSCTLDVVSDVTDRVDGGAHAVVTFSANPGWTASIPGATWIWKTLFVSDPIHDETVHFSKDFSINGAVTSATATVSADNSFSFSINGSSIGSDNTEFNYFAENQHSYNVASQLHAGSNTLQFEVKNWGLQNSSAQSNPAGLLYKIHVVYTSTAGCANPPVNTAPVITVTGANPASVIKDSIFVDLGATVFDAEEGVINNKLVATGTVDTHVVGSYTIIYNATDTQNLAATPKTRIVNVVAPTGCTSNCGTATNTPPVITVLGVSPMTVIQSTAFTDPGATAFDLEDGTITPIATGTVNTAVLGTFTITYNATDSQNLAAATKTRTVNVVPVGTPINQKPEITLLGAVVMQLVVGTPFTDPSATVQDPEDGNITNKLVATSTVNIAVIGSYTITYNATDSQNLAADTKTRSVNVVVAPTTGCTTNCGGGGGGSSTFDYFGCTDRTATNYNSLANKNDGSCRYPGGGGGGGGGGGSTPLTISNEKLTVTGTTSVTVTWNTNLPSDSRVVYGMASVPTLGIKPYYGYPLTTATDTTSVYNHGVVITGIPSAIATYYRPVSSITSETVTGIELTRTPDTVTGGGPASCEYLKEYLRLGVNNNPAEVTKLQLFLKNYDNAANLQVTGFFDITTDVAVRAFQDKYKKDVLDTWKLPSNTGYVYYTTKKKINEIYCQREFPLTAEQISEIVAFRALIDRVNAAGNTGNTELLPLVGTNRTQGGNSSGDIAGASTVKTTPVTVTVSPSEGGNLAGLDAQDAKATDGSALKPENRGRIAIADLLATAPSIAEGVTSESSPGGDTIEGNNATGSAGAVTGVSTERNLLASAFNSISTRISQSSPTTIYLTLVFIILALILMTLYFRKEPTEITISNEAPDPK